MEHDKFLCKNCFDEHLSHKGAESVKNHLTKDFNLWNNLLQKINELEVKLKSNVASHRHTINVLKEYYFRENNIQEPNLDFHSFVRLQTEGLRKEEESKKSTMDLTDCEIQLELSEQ